MGKQLARSFTPSSTPRANKIGEVLHSDVCGPFPLSIGGRQYFVVLLNDCSRRPFVYFLKTKDEVTTAFMHLRALLQTQYGATIKLVRSDRGGEYLNNDMQQLAAIDRYRPEFTSPHTPQQNGVAERFNRTLQERLITSLHAAGVSPSLWAEAAATSVVALLHSLHASLDGATPASFWPNDWSIPPLYSLRPFGCSAFPLVPHTKRRKLSLHAAEGIFLGHEAGTKGYRIWDIKERKVRISTSVQFDERSFPVRQRNPHIPRAAYDSLAPPPLPAILPLPPPRNATEQGKPSEHGESDQSEEQQEQGEADNVDEPPVAPRPSRGAKVDYRQLAGMRSISANLMLDEAADLVDNCQEVLALTAAMANDIDDPTLSALLSSRSSSLVSALVATLSDTPSHREATTGPERADWQVSDNIELDSIDKNKTADLVPPPKGVRILPTHWVRRKKRKPDGSLLKRKSRVVVNGSMQREGIDYTETFSSVGKAPTLRLLYALTALLDLVVEAYDVESVFLGAKIDTDVYVRPPPGFVFPPGKEHWVCKLNKSLYGLKQSPRLWKERLSSILSEIGFRQSKVDDGLFILRRGKSFAFHYLHVDDGKIFSNNKAFVADIRRHLEAKLSVKWDSDPGFYLGVAIERDRKAGTVKLHQKRYVDEILERFNMTNCAAEPTPIAAKSILEPGSPADIAAAKDLPLGQLVSCLLYLACWTRPDILAAVSRIGSFVSKPTVAARTAGKRVLRYLRGTSTLGLIYRRDSSQDQLAALFSFSSPTLPPSTDFFAYADADWAACIDTRHSTTGNIVMYAGAPIDWISRRQEDVATSTGAAELRSLAETGGQLIFLRALAADLGFPPSGPTILRGDNQASIAMAEGSASHRYTRHIAIKYHFIMHQRTRRQQDGLDLLRSYKRHARRHFH
ncbi:hypothetical protein JCM11641_006387 [Rhodosporidiobolus odoratus]